MSIIVGRKKEQQVLEKIYRSNEAEFVVVYGRRRVGKTYLIREFFGNKKCCLFHASGLLKGTLKKQLKKFTETISETFFDNIALEIPKNWGDAFSLLHKQIFKTNGKVIVFLDELPWMATRKSGLLQEIDYYWNKQWSKLPSVVLVVCGSSASWLIKKIIYDKGGLHNRVTCQMRLPSFTLSEAKAYLQSRKIKLNNDHVLSLYMAFGGIPYYLRYVEPGLSADENIQKIIFGLDAPLEEEFEKLFYSLFEVADAYIELIKLIAKKKIGTTRAELKSVAKLSTDGGRLTERLQDLCAAGFIEEYVPWGRTTGEYYKLIDEFSIFYLHWVDSRKRNFAQDHWITQSQRPSYYAWSGYAFEAICMKHIKQIIKALNIKSASTIGSWRYAPEKMKNKLENDGAQIDLVIDRGDKSITVCEIKYTTQPFQIDKKYYETLKQKIEIFKRITETKKQIFMAFISAAGLKKNIYSEEFIEGVATSVDLFKE